MTYNDNQLTYAATARCDCGAGLAYADNAREVDELRWACSDILTLRAVPKGQPGAKVHTAPLPFAFYEVKSEGQPSAAGATTRPGGVARVRPPAPPKDLGRVGYEAYAKSTGGKTFDGRAMPTWDQVCAEKPHVAQAWRDAAEAIKAA